MPFRADVDRVDGVAMTDVRDRERSALCDTLREVGPDAPTLCAGWTAADVAAHLVVSEAYRGVPMVVALGLRRVLPVAAIRRGMRSFEAVGDRQIERLKRRGWDWLLHRLEVGVPRLYRRPGVSAIRLVEEWIHHEDVRRGNGMPPRPIDTDLDEALWQAGVALMRFPEFLPGRLGVLAVLPDGRSQLVGDTVRIRVEGEPGEILLWLAGRVGDARVSVTGDERALTQLSLSV